MLRRMVALCAAVLMSLTLTTPANAEPLFLSYRGHVQNVGWQPFVSELDTAGTTGQALRMEAVTVRGLPATVQAHVENVGWMAPEASEATAGTTGRSLRLEAVRVRSGVAGWGIECRAHVQNVGWMAWVRDGEVCGTTGRGLRMEAVQLRLVSVAPPVPVTPAPAADRILVIGDLGPVDRTAVWSNVARVGNEAPTGVILTGDLGHGATAEPFCSAWADRVEAPLVWVQGNHEVRDTDGAVTADYAACLPGIGSGTEGVEQEADLGRFVRVITASPQQGIDYTAGSPGHARIAAAIDRAAADGRMPILVMHEPHYTVGMHGPAGPSSQALSYLARDKGVRLVLSGHDHNYSRIVTDGTTYVVAGLGGRNLRELDRTAKHWPIVARAYDGPDVGPGYLRLTVTADKLVGELVGARNDSFSITR